MCVCQPQPTPFVSHAVPGSCPAVPRLMTVLGRNMCYLSAIPQATNQVTLETWTCMAMVQAVMETLRCAIVLVVQEHNHYSRHAAEGHLTASPHGERQAGCYSPL
jgi:hypothetical protein